MALLLGLAIAGCGGSSSSSTTTAPRSHASAEAQPAGSRPLPGHPKIAGRPNPAANAARSRAGAAAPPGRDSAPPPLTRAAARRAERHAEARQAARHRALARKAGRAAPFLVPTGDNSIPTYGSEASGAQRSAAEAALSRYLQARAAGDWSSACATMSVQVTKQLALLAGQGAESESSCPSAYAKLVEHGSGTEREDPMVGGLTSLRVEGPHAFALFYGPSEQQYMMPLQEEGGAWKVTQIAPLPWPIGSSGGG